MKKKLSLVLIVAVVLAASLLGVTAFASSGVSTNENIYIGEYAHQNLNNSDPNVVIVFGTASVEETDGVTERGIVIERETEKWYFPAQSWDKETGNFGVAIIRATILDGNFTAKAYAKVGDVIETDETTVIDLEIDNVSMSATATEITVLENAPVDLKELITLEGTSFENITYTAKAAEGDYVQVAIENGVVSYVTGYGTVTITAKHELSGEFVEFTAEVWKDKMAISNIDEFNAAIARGKYVYSYLTNDIEIFNSDAPGSSVFGNWVGVLDGNGYTVRYNHDYDGATWYGFFYMVEETGIITNTVFEIDAHLHAQYNSVFAHDMRGLIENCYFKIIANQSESSNGMSIQSISRYHRGTYKNCIIESKTAFPIAIDGTTTAKLIDVAWITPKNSSSAPYFASIYVGGIWKNKYTSEQMVNFCYYDSFDNFLAGTGGQISNVEDAYTYTALETAQNVGEAWTVDATNGVSLNGKVVRAATYDNLFHVATPQTGSIVFTEAGQTEQIIMMYNDVYNEMFRFSSSNTSVATVTGSNGVVTAVAPGTAVITATHTFTGKTAKIPVTFADATYEIDSVEKLLNVKGALANELGASSEATIYAYLTKDLTVTKDDMAYFVSSSVNYYTILPRDDEFTEGKQTAASGTGFAGVFDGKGFKITLDFVGESAAEYFYGIGYTETTTIIRNVVLEGSAVVAKQGGYYAVSPSNTGYIDNCFINTRLLYVNAKNGDAGNLSTREHARAYVIGTNKGIVRNSIIKNVYLRNGEIKTSTTVGVMRTAATPDGRIENTSIIRSQNRFVKGNGYNASYTEVKHVANVDLYSNMDKFFAKDGYHGTIGALDETSVVAYSAANTYKTPFKTEPYLGNWVVDGEAKTISMKVDGEMKVVYTHPTAKNLAISEITTTSMTVGDTMQVTITEGEGAEKSVHTRYAVTNWSTVVTITQDGLITAVGAGSFQVVAYNALTNEIVKSVKITITAAA